MNAQREADILKALGPFYLPPAAIARRLNFDGPCAWCPVGPPKPGERCATVPRASREKVARALAAMKKRGVVASLRWPGRDRMYFAVTGGDQG